MSDKETIQNRSNEQTFQVPKRLVNGIHYYLNKDGLMVFTAVYHLTRGFCCKSGCTHCPYDFDGPA